MNAADIWPASSRRWWVVAAALAAIGLVDSAYLAWLKLADRTAVCAGIGDCEAVNTSPYSEVAGIPIALLGAAAYLTVLLLLGWERRSPDRAQTARLGVFGIGLAGTLYSVYLTYLEIAVLRAICPFCVVSAVCMAGLLGVGVLRMREPTMPG
jgi:uncharacterized membrane protein